MMKDVFIIMDKSKSIVCKLDQNGYLNCTIYVLGEGHTLFQETTPFIHAAETISDLCKNVEIKTVALYGPVTHIERVRQNILKNKTNFAYNNVEVYINPIGGDF